MQGKFCGVRVGTFSPDFNIFQCFSNLKNGFKWPSARYSPYGIRTREYCRVFLDDAQLCYLWRFFVCVGCAVGTLLFIL